MELAKVLIEKGARVKKPFIYKDMFCELTGVSWDAELVLNFEDKNYYFKLDAQWNILNSLLGEDRFTEEVAISKMTLDFIEDMNYKEELPEGSIDLELNSYYNLDSNILITTNKILLHREGWKEDRELSSIVNYHRNRVDHLTEDAIPKKYEDLLLNSGFEIIFEIV